MGAMRTCNGIVRRVPPPHRCDERIGAGYYDPMRARYLALLGCAGCVTIDPFAEDRAFATTDDGGGVTLVANNNGVDVVKVHFPNTLGVNFPDQITVSSDEIGNDVELLTTEAPDPLLGITISESTNELLAINARTTFNTVSNPEPQVTLSGLGLAQVSVGWALPLPPPSSSDQVEGTSLFTLFPDGRLLRSDSFSVQTNRMVVVRDTIGVPPQTFSSMFSPPSEDVSAIGKSIPSPIDSKEGVCFESTAQTSPTLGITWSGAAPIEGMATLVKDSNLVIGYEWPAQTVDTTYKLQTVIYGVASPGQCIVDVASNIRPLTTITISQGDSSRLVPAGPEGVYEVDLSSGLEDLVLVPEKATSEGFVLALEGEQLDISRIQVHGDLEPNKGPPLVQQHEVRQRYYVWIPSTVAAGATVRVSLR